MKSSQDLSLGPLNSRSDVLTTELLGLSGIAADVYCSHSILLQTATLRVIFPPVGSLSQQ